MPPTRKALPRAMIRGVPKKASGLLREEARLAIPAAGRAAVHGAKEL